MNILIPMAGAQGGFLRSRFKRPRYQIRMGRWSVLQRALAGLKDGNKLTFVCLHSHCERFKAHVQVVNEFGQVHIQSLSQKSGGQACTAMSMHSRLCNDDPLLVISPDQIIDWNVKDFYSFLEGVDPDAAMVVTGSIAGKPKFFVKCDHVTLSVSKVTPSYEEGMLADGGVYYFKYGFLFWRWALNLIKHNQTVNGEFWVAPTMNHGVVGGHKIVPYFVNQVAYLNNAASVHRFQEAVPEWIDSPTRF